jgi:Putative porin
MTALKMMRRSQLMACTILMAIGVTGTANAQDSTPPAAAPTPPAAPSESAMVNLVRLLVKQGVLKPAAGEALMKQAEAEAAQAQIAAKAAAAQTQTAQAALPDAAPGSIRVPYIPATVRNQIRDEIRTEVLAQAKAEGWASADQAAPDWTKRITLFGDIRFRSQSSLFSKTNSNVIFDFARINAQGPTNLVFLKSLPLLNSRVDRVNRLRIRGRLGVAAEVTNGVNAAFALATGDDDSPISTNQSLGGGLAKRNVWLDQAYLQLKPNDVFKASFGRFPNPFVSTPLLFDEDLRFDGMAAEFNAGKLIGGGIDLAVRGGVFPLDFNSADFPNNEFTKRKAPVKYLYSGQITAGATILDDINVSASVAYHSFQGVQGQLSEECRLFEGVTECSTDSFRVFSPRKGNTLFGIRKILLDATDPNASTGNNNRQLLGLSFDYDILDINASVRVPVSDQVNATLSGNYLRNLSFKRSDACRFGSVGAFLNNGGAGGSSIDACDPTNPQPFVGGPTGYQVKAMLGYDSVAKRGQWNAYAGYRYLESDAVLDSLTDSDFHLGGTNAKGYFLGGKYGLFDNVTIGGQWMSANQISGLEPLAIDVLQIDLEAKF